MSTNRDSNGKLAKRLVDLAAMREGILRSIGRESGGSPSSRPAGEDNKCHGRRMTTADRARIRRLRRRGLAWDVIACKVVWSVPARIASFRHGRRRVTEADRVLAVSLRV